MTRPERRKEEKKEAEEAQKRLKRVHFLRVDIAAHRGVQVFVTCARCVVGNKEPALAGALVGAGGSPCTQQDSCVRYR